MTIEERAKYAQSQHKDKSREKFNSEHLMNFTDWEYGWCQGATEQKAIDIDKACKWLRAYLLETCEEAVGYASLTENLVDSLRKAMGD